jgi:hypothetical protein
VKKNLACPGYGIRYRFNDGVAARGKLKGKSFATPTVIQSQPEPPREVSTLGKAQELTWIATEQLGPRSNFEDARRPAKQAHERFPAGESHKSTAPPDSVEEVSTVTKDEESIIPTAQKEIDDVIELPLLLPCLQLIDARTRHLFSHCWSPIENSSISADLQAVADHVSPVMLLVDDSSNGYRHVLLPLAVEDPVIQRAVCVASMFHLSIQQPELKLIAEAGRAVIIAKLQQMAAVGNVFTLSTWTTILLLLVGELVNGSDDVLTLYRMLMSFLGARGSNTDLSSISLFLRQQTDLIDYFTLPVISEYDGVHKLLEDPSPGTIASEWPTEVCLTQDVYTEAYRQARHLYLSRAQAELHPFDDVDTILLVERLKKLLEEVEPNDLGAHVLVWPYFVGAAEAILAEHRAFFHQRLDHIWLTTKYRNVKVAIDSLDNIWAHRRTKRWTSMLPDIGMVIM